MVAVVWCVIYYAACDRVFYVVSVSEAVTSNGLHPSPSDVVAGVTQDH